MQVAWAEPDFHGCIPASCYGPSLVAGALSLEGCMEDAFQWLVPGALGVGTREKSSREERKLRMELTKGCNHSGHSNQGQAG